MTRWVHDTHIVKNTGEKYIQVSTEVQYYTESNELAKREFVNLRATENYFVNEQGKVIGYGDDFDPNSYEGDCIREYQYWNKMINEGEIDIPSLVVQAYLDADASGRFNNQTI